MMMLRWNLPSQQRQARSNLATAGETRSINETQFSKQTTTTVICETTKKGRKKKAKEELISTISLNSPFSSIANQIIASSSPNLAALTCSSCPLLGLQIDGRRIGQQKNITNINNKDTLLSSQKENQEDLGRRKRAKTRSKREAMMMMMMISRPNHCSYSTFSGRFKATCRKQLTSGQRLSMAGLSSLVLVTFLLLLLALFTCEAVNLPPAGPISRRPLVAERRGHSIGFHRLAKSARQELPISHQLNPFKPTSLPLLGAAEEKKNKFIPVPEQLPIVVSSSDNSYVSASPLEASPPTHWRANDLINRPQQHHGAGREVNWDGAGEDGGQEEEDEEEEDEEDDLDLNEDDDERENEDLDGDQESNEIGAHKMAQNPFVPLKRRLANLRHHSGNEIKANYKPRQQQQRRAKVWTPLGEHRSNGNRANHFHLAGNAPIGSDISTTATTTQRVKMVGQNSIRPLADYEPLEADERPEVKGEDDNYDDDDEGQEKDDDDGEDDDDGGGEDEQDDEGQGAEQQLGQGQGEVSFGNDAQKNDQDNLDSGIVSGRQKSIESPPGNANNNDASSLSYLRQPNKLAVEDYYSIESGFIIKTRESLESGATFINYTIVTNLNACLVECWITDSCDTAIYQESPVDFNTTKAGQAYLTNSLASLSLSANYSSLISGERNRPRERFFEPTQNEFHTWPGKGPINGRPQEGSQVNDQHPNHPVHPRQRRRRTSSSTTNHHHHHHHHHHQQQQPDESPKLGFFICYLFDCAKPTGFRCQFTEHNYYTSSTARLPGARSAGFKKALASDTRYYSKIRTSSASSNHLLLARHDSRIASIKMDEMDNYNYNQIGGGLNSALIAIMFGIGATGMLIVIVGHKMKSIRQRLAYKGRRRSLVPDADYLINTMPI